LDDNDLDAAKLAADEVTRVQAVGDIRGGSGGSGGGGGGGIGGVGGVGGVGPLTEDTRGLAAPPGTVVGEFELIRVIGEGGFGIVYEAKDRVLLRHVALKEYMPASLACRVDQTQVRVRSQQYQEAFDLGMRSFINEARLLAHFDHASLVKAHRFWEANGTAYMVMPLYRGSTLKQTLKALSHPPSEDWLMALLDPLTEALLVLHAQDCFHRDIAPDNILLVEGDERPVLIDFGAARQVIGDLTHTLTAILKPGYAPVEQYADSPEMVQGPWTDVYALAATMHFAITGLTPPSAVGRLMADTYVPLSSRLAGGYSQAFLSALDRALRVKPHERTASMTELRADLGLQTVGERTVRVTRTLLEDHRPQNADRAPIPSVRNKAWGLPVLFSLALLAAGVAGAAWWWSVRGQEPPAMLAAAMPAAAISAATLPAASTPAALQASPGPSPSSAPSAGAAAPSGADSIADGIKTQFQNIVAAQTPGFVVEATANPAVLKIGKDLFGWRIRSAREGFVHILSLGADGSLLLVFPNRQDRNNRILAGQTLALPRDTWLLAAAEPPGQEQLLVFVSAHPRTFEGLGKRYFNSFVRLPTGDAAAAVQASWPHATPWLLGAGLNCTGDSCQAYGAATVTVDVRR
jgi:serine/threonine protein kinase